MSYESKKKQMGQSTRAAVKDLRKLYFGVNTDEEAHQHLVWAGKMDPKEFTKRYGYSATDFNRDRD
ncbi:MAG: hypothetical protein FWE31_02970 [Firmicutes bacterium]|nr:hypothetical protein [Bacillota bacterium]